MSDMSDFERRMKKELQLYEEERSGKPKPSTPKPKPDFIEKGFKVVLNVRNKKKSFLDEQFTVIVPTISKLEAVIEAEKQAKQAGWGHIGCVFSVEKI